MSDRALWRRIGPGLVAVVAVAGLSAFLWSHRGYIADSYALDPRLFVAVTLLSLVSLAVRAIMNRLHFGALGVSASLRDWFRLVTMTSFTNYLPFSAGLVAKALFLQRVHAMPIRRFAVGQATMLILVVATNGLVGLVVLMLEFPSELLGVVGAGFSLMAASGALLLLPQRAKEMVSGRLFPFADNVGAEARRNWPAVALSQVLMLIVVSGSLRLCFAMGEAPVGFLACVLFTAATVLTRFVSFVPGALGVREFLIGGLAVLTGFDLRDAVVASTLARAAEMLVVFGFGGVFAFSLSREVAETFAEPPA